MGLRPIEGQEWLVCSLTRRQGVEARLGPVMVRHSHISLDETPVWSTW